MTGGISMKPAWRQILLVLAVWASASGAHGQPGEVRIRGEYAQEASGMTFPTAVGDFQRVSIYRYAEDGSNESGGYNRGGANGLITATVYVYPSPPILSVGSPRDVIEDTRNILCEQELAAIRNDLARVHPSLQEVENGPASLTQGDQSHFGRHLSLRVTSPSGFGQEHPPLRTDTHLFCYVGGRWTVKFRITHREDSADAAEQVALFMRDLRITIPAEDWDSLNLVRRSGEQ
jgi:hypothetical protein